MLALTHTRYGAPDVLELQEVPRPEPAPDEVRVALRAVSLNGADAEFLTGRPVYSRLYGLFRPRIRVLGSDVAGVVDAVGAQVTHLRAGDAVYGDLFERFGGLAEYVCAPAEQLLPLPDGLSFEDAAACPQAGVIALQAIRDTLRVEPGQRGLILGAGGGVGGYAVQLAKRAGAEVTAVDAESKQEMLTRLGADRVLDYRTQDFAREDARYDFILDMPGRRSLFDSARVLKRGGRYTIVGGYMQHILSALVFGRVLGWTRQKHMGVFVWDKNTRDLAAVGALIAEGAVRSVIDRRVPLAQARQAFERLTAGEVAGKIVVTMNASA